jgi:hypothetical protein
MLPAGAGLDASCARRMTGSRPEVLPYCKDSARLDAANNVLPAEAQS